MMKKIYSTPNMRCIELDAEPVMTNTSGSGTTGTIEDVPMHGGTNGMNPSLWNEGASSNGEETIWK